MNSVPTSVILIVIAIILLYLAVTDKLARLLDAWDVLTGKSTASSGSGTPGSPFTFNLNNGQVSVNGLPPITINTGGSGPGGINIPGGF